MKKSIITAGVIVALGAGWVGASWFSGKKIEEGKDLYTISANKQLTRIIQAIQAQDSNLAYAMPKLELYLQSYKRGILSSTAKYYLNEPGDKNKSDRLYFTANIEHGPLPISELFSFNLAPKAAVINIEMDNTETSKFLFDITKGKSPLVIKIVPGTSATRTELMMTPIDYQGIKYKDISLQTIADHGLTKFESVINIGFLNIDAPKMRLNIDSLIFDSNIVQGKFIGFPGQHSLKVKSATFNFKRNSYLPMPEMKLENIATQIKVNEDEKNIQYGFNFEIGNWKSAGYDLGTIKFGSAISNIDGNAFKKYAADIAQYHGEIENDPELIKEILINHLEGLLQNAPEIKFAPISWSNKAGVSQYSATIALNKFSMVDTERLSEDQILAKILNNLDSDLSLSIPMIKELVITSIQAAGLASQADAEKQFDNAINELPIYLKQFDKNNVLTINGDRVESKLTYADNIVTLNGREIPLKHFIDSIE